jgi:hypothetical protein
MSDPPEKESGSLKTRSTDKTTSSLLLVTACQILRAIQSPFGAIFWAIEQRVSKIEDYLANEGCL